MKKPVFLISVLLLSIFSCTTNKKTAKETLDPGVDSIVGNYYYEDLGSNFQNNIFLYEDGYFYDASFYTDEHILYSDLGTYRYNAQTGIIKFSYFDDNSMYNFEAKVSDDFSSFISDGSIYFKIQNKLDMDHNYSLKEILGVYAMVYVYEEKTIVKLTINNDGTFKVNNIYPESEGMWTETGTYKISLISGFTSFVFDEWPEGNFIGIFHPNEGILHTVEGEYLRFNPNKDDIENLGVTDYFENNVHLPK